MFKIKRIKDLNLTFTHRKLESFKWHCKVNGVEPLDMTVRAALKELRRYRDILVKDIKEQRRNVELITEIQHIVSTEEKKAIPALSAKDIKFSLKIHKAISDFNLDMDVCSNLFYENLENKLKEVKKDLKIMLDRLELNREFIDLLELYL